MGKSLQSRASNIKDLITYKALLSLNNFQYSRSFIKLQSFHQTERQNESRRGMSCVLTKTGNSCQSINHLLRAKYYRVLITYLILKNAEPFSHCKKNLLNLKKIYISW